MTEEEFEQESEAINALAEYVLSDNRIKLKDIVEESKLSEDKSSVLISKFSNFFVDAQIWEKKAKAIVVKDESQKAIMDQARQGRLFIRKVRLDIEKCRKELKEESLQEGKAIDKVSNFLKDALEPIETHLDKQEHFVEYKKKAEEDRILAEAHAKEEAETLKKQQEEKEELEKLRLEKQATMKKEAEEQRKIIFIKQGSDLVKLQKIYDDLMEIDWPAMAGEPEKALRLKAMNHVHTGILALEKYLKSKQTEEDL